MSYNALFSALAKGLTDIPASKTIQVDGKSVSVMDPAWATALMDLLRSTAPIELNGSLQIKADGQVPPIIINQPVTNTYGIEYRTGDQVNTVYGPTSVVYQTVVNNYAQNEASPATPNYVYQTIFAPGDGGTPLVAQFQVPVIDPGLDNDRYKRSLVNPVIGKEVGRPAENEEGGGCGPNARPRVGDGVIQTVILNRTEVTNVVNTVVDRALDDLVENTLSVVTGLTINSVTVGGSCDITIDYTVTTSQITYLSRP